MSKRSRIHPKCKTKYKVRNWSAYDRVLVRRGDIALWFTPEAIDAWASATTGGRGAQAKYSYLAIVLVEQNTERALEVADHVVALDSTQVRWTGSGEEARADPKRLNVHF